jgi:hypothetical protein
MRERGTLLCPASPENPATLGLSVHPFGDWACDSSFDLEWQASPRVQGVRHRAATLAISAFRPLSSVPYWQLDQLV